MQARDKVQIPTKPGLANILINCTEAKTIVECTTDRVWGNGVPLGMDHCLDPECWIRQGLLGEILEEIRSELKLPHECSSSVTSLNPNRVDAMDIDPVPNSSHEHPDEMTGLPVETNITSNSLNQPHA